MLQKFSISPVCMELEEWQCIAWKDEAPNARIVHFGTERKVWNDSNTCNAFPEWYRTHLQWLEKEVAILTEIKWIFITSWVHWTTLPERPKKSKDYFDVWSPSFKN